MKIISSDKGVTFVETAVSLLILSAVMLALFRLGSVLLPSLSDDRQSVITQNHELVLRRALKQELGKVQPPWWLAEYDPVYDDGVWSFPWYRGIEEDALTLSIENTSLVITTPTGEMMIPRISHVEAALRGQIVTISLEGFYTGEILLPLGGSITPGRNCHDASLP